MTTYLVTLVRVSMIHSGGQGGLEEGESLHWINGCHLSELLPSQKVSTASQHIRHRGSHQLQEKERKSKEERKREGKIITLIKLTSTQNNTLWEIVTKGKKKNFTFSVQKSSNRIFFGFL